MTINIDCTDMGLPQNWMMEFKNNWIRPHVAVDRDPSKLRRVETFFDYFTKRDYYKRFDIDESLTKKVVPNLFVHQADRLVNSYNEMIAEEDVDLGKVRRIVDIAYSHIDRWIYNTHTF